MQNSLFDLPNRYARLSEAGGPLNGGERKSTEGRKPTCWVLLFKLRDPAAHE